MPYIHISRIWSVVLNWPVQKLFKGGVRDDKLSSVRDDNLCRVIQTHLFEWLGIDDKQGNTYRFVMSDK